MNDDNANNSTSEFYKGPTKLVWIDGRQIMQPDFDPESQTNISRERQFNSYQKTLYEVIRDSDKGQFSKLKSDEQKYEMISNMVTGSSPGQLFESRYVNGEKRSLERILTDLINQNKIYLGKDGNLYSMPYALQNKLIEFPCRSCSRILYSEDERRRHSFSHMAQQTTR